MGMITLNITIFYRLSKKQGANLFNLFLNVFIDSLFRISSGNLFQR